MVFCVIYLGYDDWLFGKIIVYQLFIILGRVLKFLVGLSSFFADNLML